MNAAEKLELHYYLRNNSHVMNALIRNRCESELLAVIQEVSSALGYQVDIESEAYKEGGLKEIWRFIGKNNSQLTLLLSTVILIFSRVPVSDSELDKLTKEAARLTVEEKKLSIEKLRRELDAGKIENETVISAATAIDSSLKVTARKSNFYKTLSSYDKVTSIGMVPLDKNNTPTADEKVVPSADFRKFIILTNELPVEIVEDARIEIISPVLKEGNYRWKGSYQGEPISFSMQDIDFKNSVLRQEISFQHGSAIECVLKVYRKLDEVGDVITTGYSAETVIKKTDGDHSIETIQGRKYNAHKKLIEGQKGLLMNQTIKETPVTIDDEMQCLLSHLP